MYHGTGFRIVHGPGVIDSLYKVLSMGFLIIIGIVFSPVIIMYGIVYFIFAFICSSVYYINLKIPKKYRIVAWPCIIIVLIVASVSVKHVCFPTAKTKVMRLAKINEDIIDIDNPQKQPIWPKYPKNFSIEYASGHSWEDVIMFWKEQGYDKQLLPVYLTYVNWYLTFYYEGDCYTADFKNGQKYYTARKQSDIWESIKDMCYFINGWHNGKPMYPIQLHIDKEGKLLYREWNWDSYPIEKGNLIWFFKTLSGQGVIEYAAQLIGTSKEDILDKYEVYSINIPGISLKFGEYYVPMNGYGGQGREIGHRVLEVCDWEWLLNKYEEMAIYCADKGYIELDDNIQSYIDIRKAPTM